MVKEIANSLGKSIPEITLDELRKHIDEMEEDEILREINVNGYINIDDLKRATAYFAGRKNIEQTKKICDTSCLNTVFFDNYTGRNELTKAEVYLLRDLKKTHCYNEQQISMEEAVTYLYNLITDQIETYYPGWLDTSIYKTILQDLKKLTSEDFYEKY